MQGPQEFLIGCVMPGFLIMVFGKEIKRDFVAAVSPPKTAKRKAKRTNRKPRTVQKPAKKAKAKKETAKKTEWTKPPIYTPADIFRIEEMFRRGRGGQAY